MPRTATFAHQPRGSRGGDRTARHRQEARLHHCQRSYHAHCPQGPPQRSSLRPNPHQTHHARHPPPPNTRAHPRPPAHPRHQARRAHRPRLTQLRPRHQAPCYHLPHHLHLQHLRRQAESRHGRHLHSQHTHHHNLLHKPQLHLLPQPEICDCPGAQRPCQDLSG